MRWSVIAWIIPTALLIGSPVAAQAVNAPVITSPNSGQILQGQVVVSGTTDIPNFASAELDFSYLTDTTNTRFLIQVLPQAIQSNILTTWDTTGINDGDYLLLLRVYLTDGTVQNSSIEVHLQNNPLLASPTPTPLPTESVIKIPSPIMIAPTTTPTSAPIPSPTTLPTNPAVTSAKDVYSGFWQGGLIAMLIIITFGIVVRLRRF